MMVLIGTRAVHKLESLICGCTAEVDNLDRVLRLQTCPVCQQKRLDNLRGTEYARSYVKGVDTLLTQKEFFSHHAVDALLHRELRGFEGARPTQES